MDIVVKEIVTKRDLKHFVMFPHTLYKGSPYWVPEVITDEIDTLRKDKNPSFEYCEARYWLAYKGNKVVGRIAGIINHAYIRKTGRQFARFGWVDFIEDEQVSRALFNAVETWASENNMVAVHGPLGFTDFDPEGMLVEGFDVLGTMTTIYNHAYYPQHLEKMSYLKDADWIEFEIKVPDQLTPAMARVAKLAAAKHELEIVKARNAKDLRPYATGVFQLVNSAYQDLYGVVQLTQRQIDNYTNQFFSFINPDFVSLIVDKENNVAAFAIAMPSLSHALRKSGGKFFPFGFIHFYRALKKNDTADFYLIAVRPDLQDKGVTAILLHDLGEKFIRNKVSRIIAHPVLEKNVKMISSMKYFEKHAVRRRRCYIKTLCN